jgi:hypothetical protein
MMLPAENLSSWNILPDEQPVAVGRPGLSFLSDKSECLDRFEGPDSIPNSFSPKSTE